MADTIIRTMRDITIQETVRYPLVDAHMHIQSNDIAPLPVMYGVLGYTVSSGVHKIPVINNHLEKQINFYDLTYDDTSGNPDVSPDNTGGPIASDFANVPYLIFDVNNLKAEFPPGIRLGIDLLSTLLSYKLPWLPAAMTIAGHTVLNQTEIGQDILNIFNSSDIDNKRRSLTDLTARMTPMVKEYGKIARQNSYLNASIYKNDLFRCQMGFGSRSALTSIRPGGEATSESRDDDIAESYADRSRIKEAVDRTKDAFKAAAQHYYGSSGINLRFGFDFSIIQGMELLYAHYWGAYGIPVYIPYGNKIYYVTNNFIYYKSRTDEQRLYHAYDIPRSTIQSSFEWTDEVTGQASLSAKENNVRVLGDAARIGNGSLGAGEKYSHFLKPVSDLELCQFEDFIKHLDYTEAATIKYPLEFLPFYHFDARRFNAPVDMIERYHDFYLFESDERHLNRIKRLDTRKIVGSIQGRDKFQFQMDLQQLKEKVLHQDRGEWTKGLFWGIKMYTAMGYPPYLFDHAASQEIFPCLQPGSYNRLLEFYEYCADHDIPITCHGSPQGMTLADPGVYLKEYLKKRVGTRYARSGKINFCINGQGFMHGIGLVDTFSSPLSWEKVIDRMSNGSELKLCLAHFGGKDFLSGTYPDTNTPYAWLNNLTGLIKEGNKVYTDISCFTFDSFRPYPLEISPSLYNELNNKIEPGLIGRMYTRYSDLQGDSIVLNHRFIEDPHISDETKRHMMELRLEIIAQSSNDNSLKAIYGELVHTAEKLASLIEQKEILRYRIMFGTDWPLMELGVTGVPAYNSAIFVLLQLVSKKLKNRWDAWHQFAVINPLRFLGLLNPPDNTAEEYSLDFTKIDKMKENIESYLNDKVNKNATEYRDVFAIVGTIIHSKLERNYQSLKYFGKDTIRSASKMTINNNSTLLLTNGRVGS